MFNRFPAFLPKEEFQEDVLYGFQEPFLVFQNMNECEILFGVKNDFLKIRGYEDRVWKQLKQVF